MQANYSGAVRTPRRRLEKKLGFCPQAEKRADSGLTCEECTGFMRSTRAEGGRHENLTKPYVFWAGRRRADDSPSAPFRNKSTGRQRPTGGRHPPFFDKIQENHAEPKNQAAVYMLSTVEPKSCSGRSREPLMYFHKPGA